MVTDLPERGVVPLVRVAVKVTWLTDGGGGGGRGEGGGGGLAAATADVDVDGAAR